MWCFSMVETITLPKEEYDELLGELEDLRKQKLVSRLKEFEENIKIKKYTRKDLGF